MPGHAFFRQDSFAGTSGQSITSVAVSASDTPALPAWSIGSGSFTLDGNGGAVGAAGSAVQPNYAYLPASGQYDEAWNLTLKDGSAHVAIYLDFNPSTGSAYIIEWNAGTLNVLRSVGGNTLISSQNIPYPAGPFTFLGTKRSANGTTTIGGTFAGTTITPYADATPLTPGGLYVVLVDYTGGNAINSLSLRNAIPTRLTLTGPTSGTQGSESAAFGLALDEPASVGGTVVTPASSVNSDAFHAASGGGTVTTLTIAEAQTAGAFKLVPATAGGRTVSAAAPGLTVTGSPVTYTVAASNQPTVTPSTLTIPLGTTPQQLNAANFSGTVTWTSDAPSVATVSGSGLATRIGPGSATITATSGQQSATCGVTIPPVTVTVSPASPTVATSGTRQFTATVAGAVDQGVTWTQTGGTAISGGGLLTVGSQTGSGAVTATSVADPTKAASTPFAITTEVAYFISISNIPDGITPVPAVFLRGVPVSVGTPHRNPGSLTWRLDFLAPPDLYDAAWTVNGQEFADAPQSLAASDSGSLQSALLAAINPGTLQRNNAPVVLPADPLDGSPLTVVDGSTPTAVKVAGLPSGNNYVGQFLYHGPSRLSRAISSQTVATFNGATTYTFGFTGAASLGAVDRPFGAVAAGDLLLMGR